MIVARTTASTAPNGGLFLTAGIDIQKDRFEIEVVAWGRGKESWSVDYHVLDGLTSEAPVWLAREILGSKREANGASRQQ